MTILNENYQVMTDAHGLYVIELRGRCTHEERSGIEANCTRRYRMIPLPNAAGAVLKALDGTVPAIVEVSPPTLNGTYNCVKVDGRCNPLAPTQDGGPYDGKTILAFYVRYQQVGGTA